MGRPLQTHLEPLKPDLAGKVRSSQTSQKMARDGRLKQRVFFSSETVYIRKSDKESQWIPDIIESKLGYYTYLIRLDNNQTVHRHMTIFDQGSVKWFQIRMTMTYLIFLSKTTHVMTQHLLLLQQDFADLIVLAILQIVGCIVYINCC